MTTAHRRIKGGGGELSSCCHCAIRERSSFFFLENVLLAVIARFRAFKMRGASLFSVGKRPQRASASKVKSSVLSELSGLENVAFNDFIDEL